MAAISKEVHGLMEIIFNIFQCSAFANLQRYSKFNLQNSIGRKVLETVISSIELFFIPRTYFFSIPKVF